MSPTTSKMFHRLHISGPGLRRCTQIFYLLKSSVLKMHWNIKLWLIVIVSHSIFARSSFRNLQATVRLGWTVFFVRKSDSVYFVPKPVAVLPFGAVGTFNCPLLCLSLAARCVSLWQSYRVFQSHQCMTALTTNSHDTQTASSCHQHDLGAQFH